MARQKRETTQSRKAQLIAAVADPNITVHDLAERFGVSLSTIRRDLAVLEDSGEIVRTYGGAVQRNRNEPTWHDKELTNRAEKDLIAQVAASRVHPGD
ncbi:MAG: DeoR family transcriptional regulator, partial [Actinomycetes bacterium]